MSKICDLWLVLKGELSSGQVANLNRRLDHWEKTVDMLQDGSYEKRKAISDALGQVAIEKMYVEQKLLEDKS